MINKFLQSAIIRVSYVILLYLNEFGYIQYLRLTQQKLAATMLYIQHKCS